MTWTDKIWLIPLLPLCAAVIIGLFGAKVLKGASHVVAILAVLGAFLVALGALLEFQHGGPEAISTYYDWFSAGGLHIPLSFYVDKLTCLYLSFITGIGLLIFIYASAYMKGDFGYFRFFAYLSLFVFAMTILVLGGNFVLLYLGWEGVGLASYLLIGYYYPRPSAVAAAKKAFITNRIGDFGFAIGIFMIYWVFGTLNYFGSPGGSPGVFDMVEKMTGLHQNIVHWIPFLLMIGAFGKSAQFPLHVWLPDAMEGPTPVSALIHAATMVTAGIYMIARCMPLFNPDALHVVACIGCFTAFLAGTIALCQYDLKRIWAYSTVSQLGYMFMGLGLSAGSAAVFHVFTHAFFKALLFLSAGSVMHAMGGELDIRKISGIRKVMPITCITMLIGCLALSGFPGFAGFFSKDEILHAAMNSNWAMGRFLGIVGLVVAFITAYYTFRVFFRVFMGPLVLPATAGHHEPSPFALVADPHGHVLQDSHGAAHEVKLQTPAISAVMEHVGHAEAGKLAPASDHTNAHDAAHHAAHGPNDGSIGLWGPLVILSLGAIFAGYLGTGLTDDWFHHFIQVGGGETAGAESGGIPASTMMIISSIIAIAGIAVSWYFHLANRRAAVTMASALRPVVVFLENKWYIDEIYHALIIKPVWVLGKICDIVDRFVVDGLVFMVSRIPQAGGYLVKPLQSGRLQYYGLGMIAGLALIVVWVLMLLW